MISRMFGAPFGGTVWGGQKAFDDFASRPISPPNRAGGLGKYPPSMVVVALGEPSSPVTCCAWAQHVDAAVKTNVARKSLPDRNIVASSGWETERYMMLKCRKYVTVTNAAKTIGGGS